MTVDAVARFIRAERRRRMRAFLLSVRYGAIADRVTRRSGGYDPQAYRRWLEDSDEQLREGLVDQR